MNNKKLWIFLVIAPAFGFFLTSIHVYYQISIWSYDGPDQEFVIRSGEGFTSINTRLSNNNLIKNARIFHRYAQFNKILKKFKIGRYNIKRGSTMLDVIETLVNGRSLSISITIPEGKNIYEIGRLMEQKGISSYDTFVKMAKDINFVRSLNIPAETIEGYLYPETYRFSRDSPPRDIIKNMVKEYFKKISKVNFKSSSLTPHEVIVLASIVEKETGASSERSIIAGVYLNRLKKNIRLYSDPTTIYGIFEKFNGNLRKKDLQQKTAYNTYRIGGLPKGPISNPGIASIKAVLNPEQHNYLYFVSRNNGTHAFTETYKQHLAAVKKWQKNRANRKGKSWRDLKQ